MSNEHALTTAGSQRPNSPRSRESSNAPTPELTQVQAERCRRRLRYFLQQVWTVIEPGSPFVPGWHIDALCDHLQAVSEGDIRNLLVNVPPRHAKSTIVSVLWPAWDWARDPKRQWLFSAY